MTFQIGQKLKFKGYSEMPEDPYFHPGETVRVSKLDENQNPMVCGLNDQGEPREDGVLELLFPEEVEPLDAVADDAPVQEEAPVAQTETPAEAPAKPAKGKAKSKAKSKADTPADAQITPAAAVGVDSGAVVTTSQGSDDFGPRSELVRAALASVASDGANESTSALLAAKDLINRVEKTYYTLGGVLAFIKETGAYKALGFDGKRGFAEYCAKELDTDYRKAQYLIDIYEMVQAAGLNEDRLTEIGWSKAKEIVRVGRDISPEKLAEDFDTLVNFAAEHNRDELIGHIKTSYEGISSRQARGETVQVSTFTFKLSADQAGVAEAALSSAKRLAGSESLDEAFAFILNDWQMMNEGSDITLDTAMAVLEHRFGVKLNVAEAAEPGAEEGQEAAAVTA